MFYLKAQIDIADTMEQWHSACKLLECALTASAAICVATIFTLCLGWVRCHVEIKIIYCTSVTVLMSCLRVSDKNVDICFITQQVMPCVCVQKTDRASWSEANILASQEVKIRKMTLWNAFQTYKMTLWNAFQTHKMTLWNAFQTHKIPYGTLKRCI
jgi:hypothetical protein